MPAKLIAMLTRDDRTVPNALELVPRVLESGCRNIGFKDVGLPMAALHEVAAAIRAAGATLYLEIVSLDEEGEGEAARLAAGLGASVLMGGTRPRVVMPILAGTGIRYYPFPGTVVGHPSRLVGSIPQIVASAERLLEQPGVDGLDLLAYRFGGDVPELMRRVCAAAADKPVIVAGSLDRAERIEAAVAAGAAGFTVGTAALNGVFPARSRGIGDQLAGHREAFGSKASG